MSGWLVALPGVGCAVMMVAMMWLMSRGDRRTSRGAEPAGVEHEAQLAGLRAEVERLRAELRSQQPEADRTP
jgi:hypothetical protein